VPTLVANDSNVDPDLTLDHCQKQSVIIMPYITTTNSLTKANVHKSWLKLKHLNIYNQLNSCFEFMTFLASLATKLDL